MPKRLNDTKAIAESPVRIGRGAVGETLTIDVRPIDNGFITRHSHFKEHGDYSCKETYSSERPNIHKTQNTEETAPNPMRAAISALNRK